MVSIDHEVVETRGHVASSSGILAGMYVLTFREAYYIEYSIEAIVVERWHCWSVYAEGNLCLNSAQ